jgi:UPF0716 protein FxsA
VPVLLLIVLVIVAEVYVFLQAVHHLGVLTALALLLLISASGPWLVRRTGVGVWRRARARLQDGQVPGRELVDGVLLLAAGLLLTLPGFVTGVAGALLLLPPVRALVRWLGARSLARRVVIQEWTGGPAGDGGDGSVITASSRTVDRTPTGGGALAIGSPGPAGAAGSGDGSGDRPDRPAGPVQGDRPDGPNGTDRPKGTARPNGTAGPNGTARPDQDTPADPAAGR